MVTAWLVVGSQGQERGRATGQESIQVLADTASTWAKSPWSGQSAVNGDGSIPLQHFLVSPREAGKEPGRSWKGKI